MCFFKSLSTSSKLCKCFLKENANVDEMGNAVESIIALLYSAKPNELKNVA